LKTNITTVHHIKVNLRGGIVAVGDLLPILEVLQQVGIKEVRFGTRQQLYFEVKDDELEQIEYGFLSTDSEFEIDSDDYPNIVSSYVTDDLFTQSTWLREGVYRDVLDSFNHRPKLKVNLVDNSQSLVPLFTGNLNFISSEVSNYWYLYVRFPKTNILYCWSSLIYSFDISSVCQNIEAVIWEEPGLFVGCEEIDGTSLEEKVKDKGNYFSQALTAPLMTDEFQLPYYEGFNKYNDKFWLGIYRRSELFSVDFLSDICTVCAKTRVAQIYTTPWKSIIIKGIQASDRKLWNGVLNKHRINVRHASNELNWQTEDVCDYGLALKHELISHFDRMDLRTFKLCFAIKTNPKSSLFGSIIIKQLFLDTDGEWFDVLHTVDFNPNSKNLIHYEHRVPRSGLIDVLTSLCSYYYELQETKSNMSTFDQVDYASTNEASQEVVIIHQCTKCLSLYDPEWGDEVASIEPGIAFSALDDTYCCSICNADKEYFIAVNKKTLEIINA
jgi:rubredoxin